MKNETEALNTTIFELQEKRMRELDSIKDHLHSTYEILKPINLLKSTLKEVSALPKLNSSILGSAIGIGVGFLFKKLLIGRSHHPVKNMVGTVIHFAIASVVAKHGDTIKSTGAYMLHRLTNRKNKKQNLNYNGHQLRLK